MTEFAQSSKLCSFCVSIQAKTAKWFHVLELYSGVGGMRYALQEAGLPIEVKFEAYDINTSANCVYEHNFGKSDVNQRNIISLCADEFENSCIDLITMSPPCQPFTRQGLKLDINDFRCESFVHIIEEFIPNLKTKPKYILIENVKGFEESQAREMTVSLLRKLGYDIKEFLLSPTHVGIPNSRLRYYLLAKLGSPLCILNTEALITDIPEVDLCELCLNCRNQYFPDFKDSLKTKINFQKKRISDFIELISENEANEYYLPEKVLNKYGTILDIVNYSSERSCCFTRGYRAMVQGTGSVLKTNNDVTVDEVYAEIEKWSENEEIDKTKSRIETLKKLKLRYFTPSEVANLMCFPKTFSFPSSLTDRQKYKLLGNSVNISVIAFLLKMLLINKE